MYSIYILLVIIICVQLVVLNTWINLATLFFHLVQPNKRFRFLVFRFHIPIVQRVQSFQLSVRIYFLTKKNINIDGSFMTVGLSAELTQTGSKRSTVNQYWGVFIISSVTILLPSDGIIILNLSFQLDYFQLQRIHIITINCLSDFFLPGIRRLHKMAEVYFNQVTLKWPTQPKREEHDSQWDIQ